MGNSQGARKFKTPQIVKVTRTSPSKSHGDETQGKLESCGSKNEAEIIDESELMKDDRFAGIKDTINWFSHALVDDEPEIPEPAHSPSRATWSSYNPNRRRHTIAHPTLIRPKRSPARNKDAGSRSPQQISPRRSPKPGLNPDGRLRAGSVVTRFPDYPDAEHKKDPNARRHTLEAMGNRPLTTVNSNSQEALEKPLMKMHLKKSQAKEKAGLEPKLNLSMAQISLVRRAWHSARRKGDLEPGLSIFQHIFSISPDIRVVFGFTGECYIEKLKDHARVFTNIIDDLMKYLDKDYLVTPEIKDLGKSHAHFRAEGFKIEYWDVFAKAMIDCTLDWGRIADRSLETQMAWTQIVMFVISKMKEGYHEEFKEIWRRKEHMNADGDDSDN